MTSRTLLSGGCVLTLGAKTPNFTRADVLIDGSIGGRGRSGLRARDAEQVDATDTIVMPGFVDTHRHAWTSLFRNLGRGRPERGASVPAAIGDHFQPEDVYAATLIGLLGAVEAGITTVVDWSHESIGRRLRGGRAPGAHGCRGAHRVRHAIDRGRRARTREAAHLTGVRRTADQHRLRLRRVGRRSRRGRRRHGRRPGSSGMRIHAHAGSRSSGAGVIADAARQGLLGEDVTLVHPSGLDDADVDAIASSGASVSLAPSSEMASGMGSPPIQQLIDADIRPGLGIDTERITPGRHVRPDAGDDLDAARHRLRPQAGREGRRPRSDGDARRDPPRHRRRRAGGGVGRGDRIHRTGHAGRRDRAPDRPPQRIPDQRPDRSRRVGHGYVERRLGVRRRARR